MHSSFIPAFERHIHFFLQPQQAFGNGQLNTEAGKYSL